MASEILRSATNKGYSVTGQVSSGIGTHFSLYYRRTHVKRCLFLYKVCSDILAMDYAQLQPTDFGWEDIEGELLTWKMLNLLPDDLFKTCKCKTGCQCFKASCSCFKAEGQFKF